MELRSEDSNFRAYSALQLIISQKKIAVAVESMTVFFVCVYPL